MNHRLLMSVVMSTVMFATHARSVETSGLSMGMTSEEVIAVFERKLKLAEKELKGMNDTSQEIKQLQIDVKKNPGIEFQASKLKYLQKAFAALRDIEKLLAECVKHNKETISMLGKDKKDCPPPLPQQEQQKIFDGLEKDFDNAQVGAQSFDSFAQSFAENMEKFNPDECGSDAAHNFLYNEEFRKNCEEVSKLTKKLIGIRKQMAHIIVYGTVATKSDLQTKKWSTTEKVLLGVGVGFLGVVVVVVGMRLYKR